MFNHKPHFVWNRNQRNGVLILLIIIFLFQGINYITGSYFNEDISEYDLTSYQNEIDSIIAVESEAIKSITYPFNPNFISDYKGYTLGMSLDEIDRLHQFRKTNKYVNSIEEFQQVTKVSDSLLSVISPLFRFPDWVKANSKSVITVSDINKATAEDFQKVKGIGITLSNRIVKFRSLLKGFVTTDQLQDVYGLEKSVINEIKKYFKVKTKITPIKINVNEANAQEISQLVYVNYQLALNIVEYRTLHEKISSLEELKKVAGFPSEKFDRIKLYLCIQK